MDLHSQVVTAYMADLISKRASLLLKMITKGNREIMISNTSLLWKCTTKYTNQAMEVLYFDN